MLDSFRNLGAVDIKNVFKSARGSFKRLSPMKIILLGFLIIIFLGTVLLCLPISSRSGQPTPLMTSYFTATSAVCVTGLIKVDTHNLLVAFRSACNSWSYSGRRNGFYDNLYFRNFHDEKENRSCIT